ncbi:MAG: hypothetical protein GY704_02915, partial [Phycisphaeraceae bacterium]|nr:hypothetical protein [Phycisphaeraceae bacterium]
RHTVVVLTDGSVACWGHNNYGQCDVPSDIGTPENPVASVAAGGSITVVILAVSTTKPCPADLDGDDVVGGSDLGLMFVEWGSCGDCRADLDGDGVVGGSDLGLLFVEWGTCP